MNRIFLVLGGNLGDRLKNLRGALKAIEISVGQIIEKSSVYETKAWGLTNQPDFLNMVIEVLTEHTAEETLNKIQEIETDFGRIRKERWGSRTMDIDILFFNYEILNTERLTIPHPLMAGRKFVLLPLAEIASEFVHPIFRITIGQLLINCEDELEVARTKHLLQ